MGVSLDHLGDFLASLDAAGHLVRVAGEVDPVYEITAILQELRGTAVLFERVRGSRFPLAANVFCGYPALEVLFGQPRAGLADEYVLRSAQRIPVRQVTAGPVHERALVGDAADVELLPNPIYNEHDGGPYIDGGILVCRDPEYGYNLSIQRLQVLGPRRLGLWAAPVHHLAQYYGRAEERGEPLEVAVVIGCDPFLYLASQVFSSSDCDEYEVAGGLKTRPIDVVRAQTLDLLVPAHAGIVIEAVIPPHVREEEGPFGEYPGYYGSKGQRPVLDVRAISYREDAVYQGFYIGKPPSEGMMLRVLPQEAEIRKAVKAVVSEVCDIHFPPGGIGKFHCVVAIKKRVEGEGKLALMAILSSRIAIKHAVVVDADIDIYDPVEVEWAIATRSQFDQDSVIVTGTPHNLDPSVAKHDRDLTTKVGIDATLPLDRPFARTCDVPAEVKRRVAAGWESFHMTRRGVAEPRRRQEVAPR